MIFVMTSEDDDVEIISTQDEKINFILIET